MFKNPNSKSDHKNVDMRVKHIESLLKKMNYKNIKYCGTQGFFDGTKHVYFIGNIENKNYEIDIELSSQGKAEIWDKSEFEQQKRFLGHAKKNTRGWRLIS